MLVNHINKHSVHSTYSKCPAPARTHDLRWSRHWSVAVHVDKVKQSLHQALFTARRIASAVLAKQFRPSVRPSVTRRYCVSMLLHYLGKLKNQKFALCMHVKHVSSVIFYHLSNRYLPNVMKISAEINTMQNINILLFVRLLSITNWRNA